MGSSVLQRLKKIDRRDIIAKLAGMSGSELPDMDRSYTAKKSSSLQEENYYSFFFFFYYFYYYYFYYHYYYYYYYPSIDDEEEESHLSGRRSGDQEVGGRDSLVMGLQRGYG